MGKFGYCDTCKHDGECCSKCYRGSYYEHDWDKGDMTGIKEKGRGVWPVLNITAL